MLTLLAQNIRRARTEQNMTQQQLAEAANLTTLSVSNIERAASWPRVETLEQIAQVLSLRPYELFLDSTLDNVISKESFNNEIKLLVKELQSHIKPFSQPTDEVSLAITHSKRG